MSSVAKPALPWALPFVLCPLFMLPLLAPSFPPLIDLPAHLSRYHIQETIDHSRWLSQYFTFQWRFVPNLGVDLLVIPLSKLVGLEPAVSLIVAAIPALMAAGILWIAREEYGRIPPTTLAALPVALSYPLIFGFVNYCLSISLAMLAFALWLNLTRRRKPIARTALFLIIGPLLLVAHLTGYGVFGLLVGGSIIGRGLSRQEPWPPIMRRLAGAILLLGWPILLLAFWPQGSASGSGGWFAIDRLAYSMAGLLRIKQSAVDLTSLALLLIVAALPMLRPSLFKWRPALLVPAILLGIMILALPDHVRGTSFAATRLQPISLAFFLLAIEPRGKAASWLAPLLVVFVLFRIGWTTVALVDADRRNREDLLALDHVAMGSRVAGFVIPECERRWPPPFNTHLTSFATSRRDAYANDQFESVEGQLMAFRNAPGVPRLPTGRLALKPCYRLGVPLLSETLDTMPWHSIDYLWLIDAPPEATRPFPFLQPIYRNSHSVMFKVRH